MVTRVDHSESNGIKSQDIKGKTGKILKIKETTLKDEQINKVLLSINGRFRKILPTSF